VAGSRILRHAFRLGFLTPEIFKLSLFHADSTVTFCERAHHNEHGDIIVEQWQPEGSIGKSDEYPRFVVALIIRVDRPSPRGQMTYQKQVNLILDAGDIAGAFAEAQKRVPGYQASEKKKFEDEVDAEIRKQALNEPPPQNINEILANLKKRNGLPFR